MLSSIVPLLVLLVTTFIRAVLSERWGYYEILKLVVTHNSGPRLDPLE